MADEKKPADKTAGEIKYTKLLIQSLMNAGSDKLKDLSDKWLNDKVLNLYGELERQGYKEGDDSDFDKLITKAKSIKSERLSIKVARKKAHIQTFMNSDYRKYFKDKILSIYTELETEGYKEGGDSDLDKLITQAKAMVPPEEFSMDAIKAVTMIMADHHGAALASQPEHLSVSSLLSISCGQVHRARTIDFHGFLLVYNKIPPEVIQYLQSKSVIIKQENGVIEVSGNYIFNRFEFNDFLNKEKIKYKAAVLNKCALDKPDYEGAIADYLIAVSMGYGGDDSQFNKMIGRAFANQGNEKLKADKSEDAIKDFDQAITLGFLTTGVFKLRAQAKKNLGLYQEAQADAKEAIRINSSDITSAQELLGEIELLLEQAESQTSTLDTAPRAAASAAAIPGLSFFATQAAGANRKILERIISKSKMEIVKSASTNGMDIYLATRLLVLEAFGYEINNDPEVKKVVANGYALACREKYGEGEYEQAVVYAKQAINLECENKNSIQELLTHAIFCIKPEMIFDLTNKIQKMTEESDVRFDLCNSLLEDYQILDALGHGSGQSTEFDKMLANIFTLVAKKELKDQHYVQALIYMRQAIKLGNNTHEIQQLFATTMPHSITILAETYLAEGYSKEDDDRERLQRAAGR